MRWDLCYFRNSNGSCGIADLWILINPPTDDQENAGNNKKPGAPDAHGADNFGGTRAGAENIEKPH
jgi:hypothetical protein